MEWHTEKRKISELVPFADNPRSMTEKQVEDLKKSLDKFNLVEIPAINTDNTIIAGHQRLNIMKLLGHGNDIIDVRVPNRKLKDKELREYCIRSNKNTGSFDYDALANNFETSELIEWGFENYEFGTGDLPDNDSEDEESASNKKQKCPKCGFKFKIQK